MSEPERPREAERRFERRLAAAYPGSRWSVKGNEVRGVLPETLTGDGKHVQTRDEDGSLLYFDSVSEAFRYANDTPSVWKVSWDDLDGDRLRFVRTSTDDGWRYSPITAEELLVADHLVSRRPPPTEAPPDE